MSYRARLAALAALSLAVAGLAGCASDSTAPEEGASAAPIELTITVAPIQFEPIQLAERNGYFDEVGLDVTISPGADPASNLAQIVSGEVDITTASWSVMSTSIAQGLPVRVLAGNGYVDPDVELNGIVVPADSPIQTPGDLEGKTVGVVGVRSGGDIPMLQAAKAAGADPDSITEVAIPYSGMQASLENGVVDAVFTSDAVLAQMVDAGHRILMDPVREYQGNLAMTLWAVSEQWLSENGEAAERFLAAMQKAVDAYNDPANEQLVREINAEVSQIDIADTPKVFVPARLEIDLEAGQRASDAMVDLGFAENAPKAADMVADVTPLVGND